MLTSEEREACVWLFHVYTKHTTEPHQWNDRAAEALYKMTHEIKHCSIGMAFIPTIPPKNSNPASYLKRYVSDVLKKQIKLLNSETTVIDICRNEAIRKGWERKIRIELMGLGVD